MPDKNSTKDFSHSFMTQKRFIMTSQFHFVNNKAATLNQLHLQSSDFIETIISTSSRSCICIKPDLPTEPQHHLFPSVLKVQSDIKQNYLVWYLATIRVL